MTVGLPLPPRRYATWEQRNRFARELLERVSNIPGVQAATIGNGGMPFGGPRTTVAVDDQPVSGSQTVTVNAVAHGYLRTLGVPLRRGRMLTELEVNAAEPWPHHESAARLWPAGVDPWVGSGSTGARNNPNRNDVLTPTNATSYVTVVGVVGDTRNDGLEASPSPRCSSLHALCPGAARSAVRAPAIQPRLRNAIRTQVRELDSGQPINGPRTLPEILGENRAQPGFIMALFTLFAPRTRPRHGRYL
jgi:hypothetical protein